MKNNLCLMLIISAFTLCGAEWKVDKYLAKGHPRKSGDLKAWENHDSVYFRSMLSPAVLMKMKTNKISFFGDLDKYGAEPPTFLVVKTKAGATTVNRNQVIKGADLTAPWIVASFQGSKGWEQFDAPWYLALQKRPESLKLTAQGLEIKFPGKDTGYIYSMPLYGYYKPPQEKNNFVAKNKLPSPGIEPWKWLKKVPEKMVKRCDFFARIARAWPIGFQESFSVNPSKDEITFRQKYNWMVTKDDWQTKPQKFATISPDLAFTKLIPGFPVKFSKKITDLDYCTGFGPIMGAIDADELDVTMKVLQYTNDLEVLKRPSNPTPEQARCLKLIDKGMEKFKNDYSFRYDHGGRQNFVWNIVADFWYARGLGLIPADKKKIAEASFRIYLDNDVLKPHHPHHGKYCFTGPGIGVWGTWGDGAKFAANSLMPIWAYAKYSGDWQLVKNNWNLIKKFFTTPEMANYVNYGRGGIAEQGDEAPPCSSYARMAWAIGDQDEYLFGCYMFARELVLYFIKMRGGKYFYEHQPFSKYAPMPKQIYPTDIWGVTTGWHVDGPNYHHLHHDRQSAQRWVRFHDPDTGRFFYDVLYDDVKAELDFTLDMYNKYDKGKNLPKGLKLSLIHRMNKENAHTSAGYGRVRSLTLNEPFEKLDKKIPLKNYEKGWGPGAIASGYAYLRSTEPRKYERLVPKDLGPSPFVLGFQRRGNKDYLGLVQHHWYSDLTLRPVWFRWEMPEGKWKNKKMYRYFGAIQGDFGDKISGPGKSEWISYGSEVNYYDAVPKRQVTGSQKILQKQNATPVMIIGPFPNDLDIEITDKAYPPEKEFKKDAEYDGYYGKVKWHQVKRDRQGKVDTAKILCPTEGQAPWMKIGYMQSYVWSPEPMDVMLQATHFGGIQAWINGQKVIEQHEGHSFRYQANREKGYGKLKKGWNRILIKTECRNKVFQMQFTLLGADGQPVPELKFAPLPEQAK